MKISAIILLLFMPMVAVAQTSQNMSQEDMQKMMQQMQKMQSCLEQIDQAKLVDALDQRSSKMRTEVESLCAKGKRDEAQQAAISFGKEMAKDPTMQSARKCTEMVSSEMMQGMMPKFPMMDLEKDLSSRHVCDE